MSKTRGGVRHAARTRGHLASHAAAPMYGVGTFHDQPHARDYDPWEHAAMLGVPIVFRDDLPDPGMVACYSEEHAAIFVRPTLHRAVERCAIAHEIVHYEHGDVGTSILQERRADRIAARRLIRPRRLLALEALTEDPAVVAFELHVTERIMRAHIDMVHEGLLRRTA
ncbi:ImmA/IrrE family metallo-endopeptidase [Microbacterium sp. NPDC057407]|uniref:ImmA/IrrE family metallo-endopeptidase n=1 Tax=Microbacterium sp. NPDC057407 TaxID=3346120 RepID=UPI0036727404